MRRFVFSALSVLALQSCTTPRPAAPPPAPPPAAALPAAPPQQDWRDVPLTPGDWTWRGMPASVARFGQPGVAALFAVRCDAASASVVLSRAGTAAGATTMVLTSSFGAFALPARPGEGAPPAIVARMAAHDPRLDQLAFSRGRFLIDAPGTERLVLPAWPEVARVIEDCRG